MSSKNITPFSTVTVEFHGLLVSTQVNDYSPGYPMPFAQTPDSPGYDDPGEDEYIDYCPTTDIAIDCAATFIDWLNLEENEEFRSKLLEEMNNGCA